MTKVAVMFVLGAFLRCAKELEKGVRPMAESKTPINNRVPSVKPWLEDIVSG
jgi:hypothetical protein